MKWLACYDPFTPEAGGSYVTQPCNKLAEARDFGGAGARRQHSVSLVAYNGYMGKLNSLSILLLAMLPVVCGRPALADGDHDQARELYAHGEIEGLGSVLKRAAAETPGDVVGIDLVQRDGIWVYRLDILGTDGHRRIVEMNASTDEEGSDASQGAAQ